MTLSAPSLLSLSGASLEPSPLDRSTLVIVDAQMEYVTGRLPLDGIAAALAEIAALLDLARSRNVPVIHVVQNSPPGRGLFEPTGPFSVTAPEAMPAQGEHIVRKTLPNSFAGTDLDERLRALGRPELILAGFMTHNCVAATSMSAVDHGYRNTIVAAATATRDLGITPAALVQQGVLAGLADRCAIVVPGIFNLAAS